MKNPIFFGKKVFLAGGSVFLGKVCTCHALDIVKFCCLAIFHHRTLKKYEMEQDLRAKCDAETPDCSQNFVGDARDVKRVDVALPGCAHVVRFAANYSVEKVVALLTNTVCNPINRYPATNLASDRICVSAKKIVGGDRPTRFLAIYHLVSKRPCLSLGIQ